MRFKKVAKLILGVFIISALFNVFDNNVDTEDPPVRAQGTYIDCSLV